MIEIFDCDQGTEEWHRCRLGIPTASEFSTVLANGRGGQPSKTKRTYMLKLIGERMTGEPMDRYSNGHMDRGHEMEPDAVNLYAFMKDVDPQKVGFIRNGECGCSPDRLVGTDGVAEIKSKLPHLQLEVLLKDELPPEHKPQVQGEIWLAEREWADFVSYWPGLPLFVKRVYRDDEYIEKLDAGVRQFLEEMAELQAKIEKQYIAQTEAAA